MVKVKKSKGWMVSHGRNAEVYQEFNSAKIENALVRAGARGEVVKQVAAKVEPHDGITTEEIDAIVVRELEMRDPKTANVWKIKRDYNRNRFKN